jgi:uncharacterized membrane protein YhhN
VNLVGTASGNLVLQWISKPLLMPYLLVYTILVGGTARPTARWIHNGLFFATIADIALQIPGTPTFMLGIAFFAAMQVCFIAAYLRLGALRRLREDLWTRLWIPLAYLAVWAALNLALGGEFGDLRIPIAVYSLLLVTMAATASLLGARVGIGGALFLISDAMIGLGVAHLGFTGRDVAVMLTYGAAQALIVDGWLVRTSTMTPERSP